MKVELKKPYGYCAGVQNVIDRIEEIISFYKGHKITCVGQIVHNRVVNDDLMKKGVVFVSKDNIEEIEKINEGVVVFSAHGTDEKIIESVKNKGLTVYDLICPFVRKSFNLIKKSIQENKDVIYIGVKNHEEAKAALSISENIKFVTSIEDVKKTNIKNTEIIVINQTTLSILDIKDIYDAILNKYPNAKIADEICNATRTRQSILIGQEKAYDGVIVVGDKNSNNSRSLYEIAKKKGYDSIFVSCYDDISKAWLKGKKNVFVISGTSTPKHIVEEICKKLENNK